MSSALAASAPTAAGRAAANPLPWRRRFAAFSIAAMASSFGVIAVGPSLVQGADPIAPVPLGLVETFGILTPAAVGNAAPEPVTVIRGDVGVGGALTGFPPGIITGTVYAGAVDIAPMMSDLQDAYDDAAGRPTTSPLPADLGGGNFGPGVHSIAAASGTAALGAFTIDGEGDPDSVFIFQVGGALALGANTTMTLVNDARAENVFWQVVGAGSIGANTMFVGTLIATTAVDSGAGSTINGRLTSLTGAITMSSTQLYSAAPSISIDGGPAAYTATSTPVITGVTSARSPMTVTVTIDGVDQTPAVTPSDTGIWTFQSPLLANGEHTIVARSVDGAGNVGSYSQLLTVDTIPPEVTIAGGENVITNDLTPTIRGTTDIAHGQIVTLTLTRTAPDLILTPTALVQADQTWSSSPNGLTAGEWTIVAHVADPAGNESTATQLLIIDVTAPAAEITSSALTNNPTPTITGTTEADVTVAVRIDGLAVTDIVQGEIWSATTTVQLGHGNHNVSVTATDAAGNSTLLTQTLDVDLVAPLISINPGATNSTNDTTPTIAGTSDVAFGVTVFVTINGGAPLTALTQAGGWNVTPSVDLSHGEHTVVASVTDPAGNIGTATQTLTITTVVAPSPTPTPSPSPLPTPSPSPTPTPSPSPLPTPMPPPAEAADYTAVGPKRVFDTRAGAGEATLRAVDKQQISGGDELTVKMVDLAGFVPNTGVGAVSLNVTSTGSTEAGFVTVYACGVRGDVSSVNFPAGKTVANAVISPVSTSGDVCFYSSTATDIIVDINGWFAAGAAFDAVGPERVFDTRVGASPGALREVPKTKLAAGARLEVRLTDLAGYVPATGVAAVSLNLVVTNPEAAGFVTVDSCGALEDVSSVNYAADQTVANAVIVPVSASGTVCFSTYADTDIIVDINGWIESGSSFHELDPTRVVDTRTGDSDGVLRAVAPVKIGGGNVLTIQVSDLAGLTPATGVSAVSLNVTATGPEGPGFITVFACGTMEEVSSLNYDEGATVANAVIAPVSVDGTICVYSQQLTDVIVDINGWIGTA